MVHPVLLGDLRRCVDVGVTTFSSVIAWSPPGAGRLNAARRTRESSPPESWKTTSSVLSRHAARASASRVSASLTASDIVACDVWPPGPVSWSPAAMAGMSSIWPRSR